MTDAITIALGAKTETLVCSSTALKLVSGAYGGIMPALARLGAMDLDAYVLVVAAGLDKKPGAVEKTVYDTGLVGLTAPLSDFVMRLTNGGRPLGETESEV